MQEAKTALSRTVRHLTAAEARLWENDQWLRQESAVWVGGSCVAPPAAPPPKMPLQACQPSEAGSFGLAVCGAIYMASNGVPFTKFDGCGELGELARQKSNEGWAKMVDAADSTVCEAALNYYFGRSTSDDEVLQDLAEGMATEGLDLLADSLLEEGGFWKSALGGTLKLGLSIKTGVDYLECAEDIEESCVASYEAWQAERQDVQSRPERLQAECKERSQERPKLTKSIEEYKTEIRRLTRLIQEEEGALEDATRQVAAAEGSLSLALSRWHSTADRALSGQSTGGGGPVISVDLPDLRGSAFTRQEWPWLGVGAGAGAFWLPTGYLQNTATA
ncbi:MAG TPA: hypothetical protein PLA94_33200, partial [Myxococcota bacterium]|nr:hypothetical protein [Myxococcota bacterium]